MRKNDLPSFSSLIAFEAAARHQSMKRASDEICISSTAISRHIRQLEESLGGELFDRGSRSVSLNPAGQYFLDAVSIGLSHIACAATQLKERHKTF